MKNSQLIIVVFLSMMLTGSFACQKKSATPKKEQVENSEESSNQLALNEKYDAVRNGVRLILLYDAQSNSFNGTVENTTDEILKKVRVEVHLSNGIELGPTTPSDLNPGEKRDIKLITENKDFKSWSAHPEVGTEEHDKGEESEEHKGEHMDEDRN